MNKSFVVLAVAVCIIGPLAVSAAQGGAFFLELGSAAHPVVMFGTAATIVFSSPIIGYLIGKTTSVGRWDTFFWAGPVWVGIAIFSTSTTSLAILNSSGKTIERQLQESGPNRVIEASIESNLATIAGLRAQIDARDPVRWAAMRTQWEDRIQKVTTNNERLLARQDRNRRDGVGSTVAQSFGRLESMGLTRTRIAVLAAGLQDAIPFVVSLMLGIAVGRGPRRKKPVSPLRKPIR